MNLKGVSPGDGTEPVKLPEIKAHKEPGRLSSLLSILTGQSKSEVIPEKQIKAQRASSRSLSFVESIIGKKEEPSLSQTIDPRHAALQKTVSERAKALTSIQTQMKDWTKVDQKEEREALAKQIAFKSKEKLYTGDVHRAVIVLDGKKVETTGSDDPLDSKLDAIWDFCEGESKIPEEPTAEGYKERSRSVEKMYHAAVKMARQDLAASLSTKMSLALNPLGLTIGSSKEGEKGGIKEIHLSREVGGMIKCELHLGYPICSTELALMEASDQILSMKGVVTVVIPERDLQEGRTDKADFKFALALK